MGKKKGGKKGGAFTKEVLQHPVLRKEGRFGDGPLEDRAREALRRLFGGVEGSRWTSKRLLREKSGVEDPWSLTREERKAKVRQARKEVARERRQDSELMEIRRLFALGMKACVKEAKGEGLSVIFLDAASDLAPLLKGLFGTSDCPMLSVQGLSEELVRPKMDFPVTCLGLRKKEEDHGDSLEAREALAEVRKEMAAKWDKDKVTEEAKEVKSESIPKEVEEDEAPKKPPTVNPDISSLLLKRPKSGGRAFRPHKAKEASEEAKNFAGQDFLSFGKDEDEVPGEEPPSKKIRL